MTIAPVEVSIQEFVDRYQVLTDILGERETDLSVAKSRLAEIVTITDPHNNQTPEISDVVYASVNPYNDKVENARAEYSAQVHKILDHVSSSSIAAFSLIAKQSEPGSAVSLHLKPHFEVEGDALATSYLAMELIALANMEQTGQFKDQDITHDVYRRLGSSQELVDLEDFAADVHHVRLIPELVGNGISTGLISVSHKRSQADSVNEFHLGESLRDYKSAVDLIYKLNGPVIDITPVFPVD